MINGTETCPAVSEEVLGAFLEVLGDNGVGVVIRRRFWGGSGDPSLATGATRPPCILTGVELNFNEPSSGLDAEVGGGGEGGRYSTCPRPLP